MLNNSYEHDYWHPANALRLRLLKASEIVRHFSNWLCCIDSTELIAVKSPDTVYTWWLSNSFWLCAPPSFHLCHIRVPRRLWSPALFNFSLEMHYFATSHCLEFMARLYVGWKAVDLGCYFFASVSSFPLSLSLKKKAEFLIPSVLDNRSYITAYIVTTSLIKEITSETLQDVCLIREEAGQMEKRRE